MSDELNKVLADNTFPQDSAPSQPSQQEVEAQREAQKEASHRVLRERAENAERRAQELERMVQMNMSQQQPTKMQLSDDEDDFNLGDDSYVEGKDLKKYVKTLKQEIKNTKKQFEEYHQQNALTQAELRLRAKYSDFDNVVTKENLEKLATHKPSLYKAIYASADIYDRGDIGYELIKSSGILQSQYPEIDKKLEDNRNKPRSSANVSPQSSDTPLSRVGDYDRRILSEDRKEQLRRQVEQAKMYKS
jgi:hypothetical protein